MKTHKKSETVLYKSVGRVADVLLCLVNDVNTVTEIAGYCKVSKSTISRLLAALVKSNLITQDPSNHRFYMGPLIAHLSSNPLVTHKYLVVSCLKEMLRLRELSRETVFLSILFGIQYMNLYQMTSDYDLRITEEGKMRGPVLFGATARVLLAQASPEDLRLAMRYLEMEKKYPPNFNKEVYVKEIDQIREQGYAITCGENIPGVLGVSVPVKNYICPAALSIVGFENRLKPKMGLLTEEILKTASQVSSFIKEFSKDAEGYPAGCGSDTLMSRTGSLART